MAVKTYIDGDNMDYAGFNEAGSTQDFVERNYDEQYAQQQAAAGDSPEVAARKRKVKSDILCVAATGLINAIPMISDGIKHKKDPTPHRVKKGDLIRFGASLILPTIQAVDTIIFKEKLQTTLAEKTPVKFSDVRNVINLTLAYPSTHRVVSDFMSNVSRQTTGQQQVSISKDYKSNMLLSCATLFAPYITDRLTDDRLSFVERCSSVIPIKMFGGLVKKVVTIDPRLQRGYDVATSALRVAEFGNRQFSSAVRSNHGMRTGAANTLGSILDIAQDAMGMSRGNISQYGGYDGWNGGSRWSSF